MQDPETLLGRQSLAAVLLRRTRTPIEGVQGTEGVQEGTAAQPAAAFQVEQGLIDLTLFCLSKSEAKRQRDFAAQVTPPALPSVLFPFLFHLLQPAMPVSR